MLVVAIGFLLCFLSDEEDDRWQSALQTRTHERGPEVPSHTPRPGTYTARLRALGRQGLGLVGVQLPIGGVSTRSGTTPAGELAPPARLSRTLMPASRRMRQRHPQPFRGWLSCTSHNATGGCACRTGGRGRRMPRLMSSGSKPGAGPRGAERNQRDPNSQPPAPNPAWIPSTCHRHAQPSRREGAAVGWISRGTLAVRLTAGEEGGPGPGPPSCQISSPGLMSSTLTPAPTSSWSEAGVPLSTGNVAKCMGTTVFTPSSSTALAALLGPIVK